MHPRHPVHMQRSQSSYTCKDFCAAASRGKASCRKKTIHPAIDEYSWRLENVFHDTFNCSMTHSNVTRLIDL